MIGLRAKIEAELRDLVSKGIEIVKEFDKNPKRESLFSYQTWYTRALSVVREVLPDRLEEFSQLYKPDRKSEKQISPLSYGIADFLLGIKVTRGVFGSGQEAFDHTGAVATKLMGQVDILQSALSRLADVLANIRGVLQAELFDTELDAARELLRTGHSRAAGAVAGVVLERHLSAVAAAHNVTVKKRDPSISDLNEAIKAAGIIDIPNWRNIQRLSDIRNLCTHQKQREPTVDEVRELIDGTDKFTKSLA